MFRIFDGGIPDRVLGRGSTITLFRVFALVKQKIKNKKAEAVNPGYSHAFLNLSTKSVISLIYT